MRVGVHINQFGNRGGAPALGAELAAAGRAAEAAGVSWLSVMDHYFQMEFNGGAEEPMLEAYTTLGYLAGQTSTVQLGALVTGVTYRHPGLLAKIATTLDVLSGGRATLGIGAAWYDREHEGLGVPFPPLAERFERLDEALRICLQMWDPENNGPFEGRHYRLAETLCVPAPVSEPRPEIMIGGSGEKKTLRLVARHGDACNLFATSPDEVRHKIDVLRGHCDTEGRDFGDIRVTITHMGEGDVDTVVRGLSGYAKLGIDTVIFGPRTGDVAAWIEEFAAPAVPRLAELD
ncbi:LLM class F420-dependent oxidoreductase [Streptomyces griseoviridis]|uniref:LLM class F420-dependent oxidoreductase n=2 Tax=Streptomyces TaxID=1883 RepID=A0A3Q9KQ89_STRGD|nr:MULTISPECIES: LLM class F420-dependent oxidoreductase [Streptomyces]AZS83540.1 LLM class F420-dependent oxidoreductase [Streptomyces griseoviridis]MDH6696342.1 F420-dependent oxidoreductase-like protein [Streptomyces sp. MAA16]MDT0475065.1 LLM class F420-dependent oxidoreductase [Streptomyces sp. DSM 41014]QCN89607.1 LLM class F420-dependent oxidoreductase [Streptomyces griseoviridis]